MIRKYHNHKLQTRPWHRDEEPHSNHETLGRKTKQNNPLLLHHQDDCKTRMDIKKRTIKHRTITESHIEDKLSTTMRCSYYVCTVYEISWYLWQNTKFLSQKSDTNKAENYLICKVSNKAEYNCSWRCAHKAYIMYWL